MSGPTARNDGPPATPAQTMDSAGGAPEAGGWDPAEVVFRGGDALRIDPADWARRAAEVRRELAADGIGDGDLDSVLAAFGLADDAGRAWLYTAGQWMAWTGSSWVVAAPPGPLRIVGFSLGLPVSLPPEPSLPSTMDEAARPTHLVPPAGLPAWPSPDPASAMPVLLVPGTPLEVLEWQPSGWARVLASNGWTGWVDGRLLQPLP